MDEVEDLVTPYDVQSIMHYREKDFSSNDRKTIGEIFLLVTRSQVFHFTVSINPYVTHIGTIGVLTGTDKVRLKLKKTNFVFFLVWPQQALLLRRNDQQDSRGVHTARNSQGGLEASENGG